MLCFFLLLNVSHSPLFSHCLYVVFLKFNRIWKKRTYPHLEWKNKISINYNKNVTNIIAMTNQKTWIRFHTESKNYFLIEICMGEWAIEKERRVDMEMVGNEIIFFFSAGECVKTNRCIWDKKKFVMVQIWLIVDRDVLCWNECQFSTFRKIQIILTENFLITHYTALNLIWVICKATKKSVKLPLGCVRTKRQQTLRLCVQQQNSGFSLISWKIVSERTHPICTLNELRSLLHEPDCLGDYQSKQCRV